MRAGARFGVRVADDDEAEGVGCGVICWDDAGRARVEGRGGWGKSTLPIARGAW